METVPLFLSAASLIFTGILAFYTWRLWGANKTLSERLREEAELSLLHQLQSQYTALRARMGGRYSDETWTPDRRNEDEWRPLEEYWFFCFQEWLLTKGAEHGRYSRLWDDHIRDAVKAGLSHRPLRYVLVAIRKGGSLQDIYAGDFIKELISIHGSDFHSEF